MERKKYYSGVKLCPKCKGAGLIERDEREAQMEGKPDRELCPQCEGSGRVKYSTEVLIHEEPYFGLYNNIGE